MNRRQAMNTLTSVSDEERLLLRFYREMVAAKDELEDAVRIGSRYRRARAVLRYAEAKRSMALLGGFDDIDEASATQTLVECARAHVESAERLS